MGTKKTPQKSNIIKNLFSLRPPHIDKPKPKPPKQKRR